MMPNYTPVYRAENAKVGFTLGDLIQVLQHADQTSVDPRSIVKATVGFRGQLQEIRIGEPK